MSEQEHIPVPSGHAPRLDTYVKDGSGYYGIVVTERETGATIHCKNPVEVRR